MSKVTKNDIENKLKKVKGWICTRSGNEYIYDFHLVKYPIIVKVASSVRIDNNRPINKNSERIRVFAVQKKGMSDNSKIVAGLIKARKIHIDSSWEKNLEKQVCSVINSSKVVYDKHRKQKFQSSEFLF